MVFIQCQMELEELTFYYWKKKKGRVERDLGARKAEPFIAGQYPTQPYCVVASKAKSLSLGNCKVFGANLLLLVFAQKLPEHKVQSFTFPFYSLKEGCVMSAVFVFHRRVWLDSQNPLRTKHKQLGKKRTSYPRKVSFGFPVRGPVCFFPFQIQF